MYHASACNTVVEPADVDREMPNADESEDIQELRMELMEMELDELKTRVLAVTKELQPDVEFPIGDKEEIVAWAIEWQKAWEAKKAEEEKKRAEEEKKRALEMRTAEHDEQVGEPSLTSS